MDWLEGGLDPQRAAAVADRLTRAGADPQSFLPWAQRFLATAAQLPLTDPPALLRQRLRRLMSASRGPRGPRVVRARLVGDTRVDARLAQVRSAGRSAGTRYQLTFESDDVDLVLDVATQPDQTLTLRGQVLPGPGVLPVFEATVHWPDGVARTRLGDELGGFDLYGVPVTARLLIVTNDEVQVEAPLDLLAEPS